MEELTINIPEEIYNDVGKIVGWDDTIGVTFESQSDLNIYYQYNPHTLITRKIIVKRYEDIKSKVNAVLTKFHTDAKCSARFLYLGPVDFNSIVKFLTSDGRYVDVAKGFNVRVIRTMNEQEPSCGR